jgi:ABC-2 type transport system permease protein
MSAVVWETSRRQPGRTPLSRYAALAGMGLRYELSARGALATRAAFYLLILVVFSRLWDVASAHGVLAGATKGELLWYLAITEWVLLSVPPLHLEIEADVRTGDLAYQLPRPLSYLGARLAEAAGTTATRLLTLGVLGAGMVWIFAGELPRDPRGLLLAIPLGIAAAGVTLLLQAAIGVSAFWLQDVSPIFWIWQKAAFVLGGLMLPLELYPEWLRSIAAWTPFAPLLNGPGRMAFGLSPDRAAQTAAALALWGLLTALTLTLLYRRGLRALDVNGG